jgi:uncharacterized protein with ParB-like and HNH nuclease domain
VSKVHSGLNYDAVSIQDLFSRHDYYQVPRYQRGYSWTNEEVQALLDDLYEVYTKFPDEAYLLGQIIVCPSINRKEDFNSWDVIDGQQRLTTLYLIALTIYRAVNSDFLDGRGKKTKQRVSDIESLLYWFLEDDSSETPQARLNTAADGPEFVNKLLQGQELPEQDSSPTQGHIREAIETIEVFFQSKFENLFDSWKFLEYILDHAVVIKLQLDDTNHALRVFLKVNNRGLVLDDADLLKSLLFQKVQSDSDFDTLSKNWDTATNSLYKSRLKRVRSMEFLMKLLIGIKTGNSVSTGKVFDEWSELLTTEIAAKEFGKQLPTKAANLAKISAGKLPTIAEDPALDFRNLTYGTQLFKTVQHFEVLLAGDHLTPITYGHVAQLVEDRTILSSFGNEKSQDYERKVHSWANSVSQLHSSASLEEVREKLSSMFEDVDDLFLGLRIAIPKLSYLTTSHHTKIRYVLARTAKYVQESVASLPIPLQTYMTTTRKNSSERGYDIDHVFPKSTGQRSFWKPGTDDDGHPIEEGEISVTSRIHSIGNLVLLHPSDNNSQGDALPWDEMKTSNYSSSELWINRLLTGNKLELPRSAKLERFEKWQGILKPSLTEWNTNSIKSHTELYCQILEDSFRENLGL